MERLNSRVEESGWNKITKINNKDLLTQYGTISIEDCKKEANKYLTLDSNGKLEVNKKAQMTSVDYNVTTFNGFFRLQMDSLQDRGETYNVLINLFKGYLVVPDKEFNQYIKQKKNNYKEGQDILQDDIMTMVENKYKSQVRGGEWNAPSKEQKEILALTAKLDMITNKKKVGKKRDIAEGANKKYEWKKIAPKDVKETKSKNGKTYQTPNVDPTQS